MATNQPARSYIIYFCTLVLVNHSIQWGPCKNSLKWMIDNNLTRTTPINCVRDLQKNLEWLRILLNDFKWLKRIKLIKKVKVWPTDQPTDGQMDKAECRVACKRLKTLNINEIDKKSDYRIIKIMVHWKEENW